MIVVGEMFLLIYAIKSLKKTIQNSAIVLSSYEQKYSYSVIKCNLYDLRL